MKLRKGPSGPVADSGASALANVFWVDQLGSSGGLPFTSGASGPFSTIQAALSAAEPAPLVLYVVGGFYDEALDLTPFPSIIIDGVGVVEIASISDAEDLTLRDVSIVGALQADVLTAYSSSFDGSVTLNAFSRFFDCTISGSSLALPGGGALSATAISSKPTIDCPNLGVDAQSLYHLGNYGATALSESPVFSINPLEGNGAIAAWLRDEDRSLNGSSWTTAYAALLSQTLTEDHTLTVSTDNMAAAGLFIIDVYGDQNGHDYTVNGTSVVPSSIIALRSIFQNVEGALSLIQQIQGLAVGF